MGSISGIIVVLENARRVLLPYDRELAEYHKNDLFRILGRYERVLNDLRTRYNENYRITTPTPSGLRSKTWMIVKKVAFDHAAIQAYRNQMMFHNGSLTSFIGLINA
jgi:hypothetical protein